MARMLRSRALARLTRFDTVTAIRAAKAVSTLSVGGFAFFPVFNNLTDYRTNFEFVKHVMTMDAQQPELAAVSNINYRAVPWNSAHHAAYGTVIGAESVIMTTCLTSAWRQFRALYGSDAAFHEAKRWGVVGCATGLFLWFFVFQAVAGEWFGMWMNETWNGIPDAVRLSSFIGGTLIFLGQRNDSRAGACE